MQLFRITEAEWKQRRSKHKSKKGPGYKACACQLAEPHRPNDCGKAHVCEIALYRPCWTLGACSGLHQKAIQNELQVGRYRGISIT